MFKLEDLQIKEVVFENPLIGLHLKCLRLFGYIVYCKERSKHFQLLKGLTCTASFVIFCYSIFIKISHGFNNLSDGATSCATAFLYLSTSIATANTLIQRTRLTRMVSFLHEDITSLLRTTDSLEENMISLTVRYLRIVTGTVCITSVVGVILLYTDCFYRTIFLPETVFNVAEILNATSRPIILFQMFPFVEVYDNFVVAYLASCYALFLGLSIIPCWHTFVTCLMMYVVVKFEIINKRLVEYDISKLFKKNIDKNNLSAKELLYWHTKMYAFFVKEHIKIRWFTSELQSLIRIPVFIDFIIFSVLICFLLYSITTGTPTEMDYLFAALYLSSMTSILWLYYWHATLISAGNHDLCLALYSSNWYEFPVNVQNSIRLMMMQFSQPLILKAILVELNLRTFINVVRGAFSYFSILRNANFK